MARLTFYIIVVLILGCGRSVKPLDSDEHEITVSDSVSFTGQIHYSDVLEHFDTMYNDTLIVYYYGKDSVSYKFHDLRHKFFEQIDSIPTEEFIMRIGHGGYRTNISGNYSDTFDDEYIKGRIALTIGNRELLYYYHVKQNVANKEEFQRFLGRAILKQ